MKILIMMAFAISLLFSAVDINNADKKELTSLKGIGEKKADEIISYRKGKCFKKIDDLTHVKGIGPKFIANNKKNLTVGKCKNK